MGTARTKLPQQVAALSPHPSFSPAAVSGVSLFCVFRSEAFMHHTVKLPLARRYPASGIGFGNSDESAASQSGLMRRCFSAATNSFAVSSVNAGF